MTARARFCALILALAIAAPGPAAAQSFRIAQPTDRRDEPLEILSERLEVDQNTGITIFIGNVQATQGDLHLTSDRLQVFTVEEADGRQRIVQLRATGDAVLVTPTEAAEADEMDYFIETELVEARGDVILVQGDNTLTGEALTMNLATGEGQVTGGVRTIFRFD